MQLILQIISKFTDKIFVIRNGEMIEYGPTSEVMANPKHNYTKFLIKSMKYDLSINDFNNLLD